MTMPRLMNCDHQLAGWCLDCVGNLDFEFHETLHELRVLRERFEILEDENLSLTKENSDLEDQVFDLETDIENLQNEIAEQAEQDC